MANKTVPHSRQGRPAPSIAPATNERRDPGAHDAPEVISQADAQAHQLRLALEHAQRLSTLGVLAAGVCHEINNILTPVLAYAQLASNNPQDTNLQAKAISKAVHGVQTRSEERRVGKEW